jgi:hypothetical protein
LMKQPALLLIPFGAIYLLWDDVHRRFILKRILLRNLIFWIAAIVPLAITCVILWYAGVFDKFWFWTVRYAAQYGSIVPLNRAPEIFFRSTKVVIGATWALWILAGIGAVAGLWDQRLRGSTAFSIGLLFFSALALCPGFYFRSHYFILVLPAVSLLAGAAISKLSDLVAGRMILVGFAPLLLLAGMLSVPVLWDKKVFFDVSPIQACGLIYPENPFLESVRIADYVREHTGPDDTIAVLGSEPQVYFYAQRHSATGYIYTYSLMEPQKYAQQMQQEMMREIESARPKYLISVAMSYSWLRRPDSDPSIFTWANEYMTQNYVADGFVNIMPRETDYFFGDVPPAVQSLKDYILIYKRKS